jgi:hypothetical protein
MEYGFLRARKQFSLNKVVSVTNYGFMNLLRVTCNCRSYALSVEEIHVKLVVLKNDKCGNYAYQKHLFSTFGALIPMLKCPTGDRNGTSRHCNST